MVVYVANACGCLDTRIGPAFGQSQILLGQHLAGLSVSYKLAREKHGLGVFGPDVVEIMQHADDRAPFGMPTADQMRQITDRTCIDGAVGFVKQDQGGVLQHEAGETGTLLDAKASGGDVRLMYSPMDVLGWAKADPDTTFAIAAVGFETTLPVYALLMQRLTGVSLVRTMISGRRDS